MMLLPSQEPSTVDLTKRVDHLLSALPAPIAATENMREKIESVLTGARYLSPTQV
jgi:hypothetical protein